MRNHVQKYIKTGVCVLALSCCLPGCALVDNTAKNGEKTEHMLTEGENNGGGVDKSIENSTDTATESGAETVTEAVTEAVTENITEAVTEKADTLMPALMSEYLDAEFSAGAQWAVAYENLETGQVLGIHASQPMLSASVIKVFIMGAVYDRIVYPADEAQAVYYTESYEGELRSLLNSMITVSDNSAANRLVEILGGGSFSEGAAVVNQFCESHGFKATHLGRAFMGSNAEDDNYTSAEDCRLILEEIYRGTLVNEDASGKMLAFLKDQTRKNKIPSGLSEGNTSANKTGEMPEGYGLGCIENDMAIVFTPQGDYILTVLSGDLGGRNSSAISTIAAISAEVLAYYNAS